MIRWVSARNPVQTFWGFISVNKSPTELSNGVSIAPVRLRVVVVPIDVSDDVFSGLAIFERVSQATDVLGQASAVAEQIFVTVVADLGLNQIEPVAELDEKLRILFCNCVTFLNSLSEPVNLAPKIPVGHYPVNTPLLYKHRN